MLSYHDHEWGLPVWVNDRRQFEFLVLESAQAGLSWRTILYKREGYRHAYEGFDVEKVSRFGKQKFKMLVSNPDIVRNSRKIEASIINARAFISVQKQFGSFCKYLWRFVGDRSVVGAWNTEDEIPSATELSRGISLDLKSRGFKFLGPTIVYSHLQAVGIVNDHVAGCFRFGQLAARKSQP